MRVCRTDQFELDVLVGGREQGYGLQLGAFAVMTATLVAWQLISGALRPSSRFVLRTNDASERRFRSMALCRFHSNQIR